MKVNIAKETRRVPGAALPRELEALSPEAAPRRFLRYN